MAFVGTPTRPLYIPAELVDLVLAQVDVGTLLGKKIFSSCSLVSHTWLALTRQHRYKRLEFTLGHPFELRATANHAAVAGETPRPPLLEALQEHSVICPHVRFLDLRVTNVLEHAWRTNNDTMCGISLLWLHEVLCLLPRLNKLRLPMVIYGWHELSAILLPVVPHLGLLEIKQPSFFLFEGGEVREEEFQDMLNLFGSINLLTLDGPDFSPIPDSDLPPTPVTPLVATKIRSLSVHGHSFISAGVLRPIANLPDAALLTSLILTYVFPEDILHLVKLLDACSKNLGTLTLQLEPSNGSGHPPESPSHYLPVNLSQCVKLHTLSLKIRFYAPAEWVETAMPVQTDAKMVAFLHEFLARPIPNLTCLDVKLCGGTNKFDLEMVGFDEIERLLWQFHSGRKKTLRLTAASWWEPQLLHDWDWISRLFPKLLDEGILQRSV